MAKTPKQVIGRTIVCAGVILSLAWSYAYPHDHDHPELNEWYKSLSSGKGPCCDGSDAKSVLDPDWESQNKEGSHYRVRLDISQEMGKIDMQWVDVPDEAVVNVPNKAGIAKVWPIRGYLGVSVRCFLPGSMT